MVELPGALCPKWNSGLTVGRRVGHQPHSNMAHSHACRKPGDRDDSTLDTAILAQAEASLKALLGAMARPHTRPWVIVTESTELQTRIGAFLRAEQTPVSRIWTPNKLPQLLGFGPYHDILALLRDWFILAKAAGLVILDPSGLHRLIHRGREGMRVQRA